MQETEILKNVIKKYQLKKGQYIDYEFFKNLYKECDGKITEEKFAEIIGIKKLKYRHIRALKGKTSILSNMVLNDEEKAEVLQELIKKFDLTKGQYISYEVKEDDSSITFCEMYEQYKTYFSETEFAELLGISYDNLRNMRRKSQGSIKKVEENKPIIHKARILTQVNSAKEKQEKIYREKIKLDPLCKEGRKINYEQLQEAYQKYKASLTEFEFASLLGIGDKYYYTLRQNSEKKAYIKDYDILQKIEKIVINYKKIIIL